MSNRLIKQEQCKIAGRAALPISRNDGDVVFADAEHSCGTLNSFQARVVESSQEHALIEVTCSCGSKCLVQCNYARDSK